MGTRKCCMVGCENFDSRGAGEIRRFHAFPMDFNLCMLWVQNSGRPEYFEDFAFAGAQPFMNRHICSDHFNDKDFVDPREKLSGLLPDAVPNLNLVLPKIEVKEECTDSDFAEALAGTLIAESEILNEIKLEKFENDNCDEVNANFSFSSTDDSCNDLLGVNVPKGIEIYKETQHDKDLSDEFFRNFEDAIRCNRGSNRRANETDEERAVRLKREALRAKIRRSQETEEQRRVRRMKNALRAAFRRHNETPEQRTLRKKKDMLRAQRRRKAETESETRIRRYNDAVRTAFRRNNETEQQRMERKMKDIIRAAKRRSMETPEQRETRLKRNRERASRSRMLKRIADQVAQLNRMSELAELEVPIILEPVENGARKAIMTSLQAITAQCNDSSSLDQLQQVLAVLEGNTNKRRRLRRPRKLPETNEERMNYIDILSVTNKIPTKTDGECIEGPSRTKDNSVYFLSSRGVSDVTLDARGDKLRVNLEGKVSNSDKGLEMGVDDSNVHYLNIVASV